MDEDAAVILDRVAARLNDVEGRQGGVEASLNDLVAAVRRLAVVVSQVQGVVSWTCCPDCGRCHRCRQVVHEHTPEGGG